MKNAHLGIEGYFTPEGEVTRQAVNAWIRTGDVFDAVIDFDTIVRDPEYPTRLFPAYDGGDHLHINDAGFPAMANGIDLALFQCHDVGERSTPVWAGGLSAPRPPLPVREFSWVVSAAWAVRVRVEHTSLCTEGSRRAVL